MHGNSDVLAIVSTKENKIYFIDFKILKENYTKGTYKKITHAQQDTHCFLCELWQVKKWGALLDVINYAQMEVKVA